MLDQLEERLAEEVRKDPHLYDSSSRHYKDIKMSNNSWREVAENTGQQSPEDCAKRWKNLRDTYARLRGTMVSAGGEKVPVLVFFLSWLAPHIKHRETSSNYDAKPSSADPYSQPSPTSHQPSTSPVPPLTSPVPLSVPTLQETLQSTSPVPLSSIPAPQESQSSQPSSSCGPVHSFTSSDTSASWPETPQLLFSSPQGASASPAFVPPRSPQSRPGKKRKNRDQDDWFIERMKQLEGRLLEVQKAVDNNDEYSRFGQTVADMLRRVPEDNRGDAMFAVYRVSICGRTHRTALPWQCTYTYVYIACK